MKKLLKKVISLTAALAMATAYSASATVTTGGGSSASDPYYWQENFNDYTNTTEDNENLPAGVGKSSKWKTEITANDTVIGTTAAHSYGDGNYALKASASGGKIGTNNSFLFINSDKTFNQLFAGGDIIVSYDVRFTASNPKFRMQLVNTSGTNVVMGSYFQSSNGLTAYYTGGGTDPKKTGNVTTTVKNTDYKMTLLLHKLSDTSIQVRQFCNGTELVDTNGTTIELTTTLSSAATLDVKASLRFYVYSGTTAIIDNVNIKNFTSEAIETFGDSASVTEQVCTSSYITLDKNGNKLLYKNTATSGLPELTYNFNNPFDFDGGNKKMLVSFKVELNQDITYIQTSGMSHLLVPNVSIGSKTVYMPAIEHYGFRARTSTNGRYTVLPEESYI